MRHMMNLESMKTYGGSHDIQTLILDQRITGLPLSGPALQPVVQLLNPGQVTWG